jgi:myo-inositol-1-phosphate synthase
MAVVSPKGVLLLVAGIRGAVGSTLAAAVSAIQEAPQLVSPYLMTAGRLPWIGGPSDFAIAGWDTAEGSLAAAIESHGVLEKGMWSPYTQAIEQVAVKPAPAGGLSLKEQVLQAKADMEEFRSAFPAMAPVFINLLPAGACPDVDGYDTLEALCGEVGAPPLADLVYVIAAVDSGIPVVNFTPNRVEVPAVVDTAQKRGVPVAGRDGKTGQTYFKVVLASALRARALFVNGWYSLNILGNADGENLMDPEHAACKLENKTDVLKDVLGYSPGLKRFGKTAHQVRIDYYPPRGDAKEAWDVIDFESIFGLPMSLRVNLQGRDSILAAPMVLDLSRWLAAARAAGRSGLVPELCFYFKKAAGGSPAAGFGEQLEVLARFEGECSRRHGEEA